LVRVRARGGVRGRVRGGVRVRVREEDELLLGEG
jgi:hypothetical protein